MSNFLSFSMPDIRHSSSHFLQNPYMHSRENTSQISQLFKMHMEILNNSDSPLEHLEEPMFLACFMRNCLKGITFSIDPHPYAKIFETNCKRFMAVLDISQISSEEKDFICSGNFTWEYLQQKIGAPLEEKSHLVHLVQSIFFSNDDEASSEFRDALESPGEEEEFAKYKHSVFLFIEESISNVWEVILPLPTGQIRELIISSPCDQARELITSSCWVQNLLSKALMREAVTYLGMQWNHAIDPNFIDNLNAFIRNFNYNNYKEWKIYIEYLLGNKDGANDDYKTSNLFQITCDVLIQYFYKSERGKTSPAIYLTRLHYAFLFFFLDLINVLNLDAYSTRFHPNYKLMVTSLLSEVSIESICSGVLTHFHPKPPSHSTSNISVCDLMLCSKKRIQNCSKQDSFHIHGINQIFTALFHEKEENLPEAFRRYWLYRNLSKFSLHFTIDNLEIKVVKVSKTLFHFLTCLSYEYLSLPEKEGVIFFCFRKYFDLSEFQTKGWGENRPSFLSTV